MEFENFAIVSFQITANDNFFDLVVKWSSANFRPDAYKRKAVRLRMLSKNQNKLSKCWI